jgi:hypothetical protein
LTHRLTALEQQLQAREQQAQQEQQVAHVEAYVDAQLAGIDGLSKRAQDIIVSRAVALPPTPDGMPDIQAAHQEYVEWRNEEMKGWADSKRTHHISAVGGEGKQALPLDASRDERQEAMAQRFAELENGL